MTPEHMRPVDQPLDWGRAQEMSPFETVMWRAESNSTLSSAIVALELLDTAPDWDRLYEAHEWASRMVPRFRKRVVEPPLGLGAPRWSVDPSFDLSYHVRRTRLPDGGGWADLLADAARVARAPFDRNRPPWEAVLYEGLPDGKAAYLLKLHHSATDGMGGVQLLSQLHRRDPDCDPAKPQPPAPQQRPLGPLAALGHQVADDARVVPRLARTAAGHTARAVRSPARTVRDALRYGRSLRRVLSPPEATGSPLLAGRSLSWRFGTLDVDYADLRAAGKAAGGSLNDAYLAALLGAYRLYHERFGAQVDAIPMAIPISVRRDGDDQGGNRIASARLSGPLTIRDPAQRIAALRALIRTARDEPALDSLDLISAGLARLPGSTVAGLLGDITKGNDLQASNVPGIRDTVYLAGARVERLYPYAPLPGCAAMITMVSHGDVCCVGVNYDAAAFTDAAAFAECLAEGFSEVLALHPGARAPVRRF